MPRVLITGGAGNLARLCVAELESRGYEIVLFDRNHPEDAPQPWKPEHQVVIGELSDPEAIDRAFGARPEIVIHLGANPIASDHPSIKPRGIYSHYGDTPRDNTWKSNVLGTYYVLDRAAQSGVRRVVAASSFFVLGLGFRISGKPWVPRYLPIDEMHPNEPEDSYSLSKVVNEEMYRAYARAYRMTIVGLRFMGIYYRHSPEPPGMRFRQRPLPPANPKSVENLWITVDGRDAAQAVRRSVEAEGLAGFEPFFVVSTRSIVESPKRWFQEYYPDHASLAEPLGDLDALISSEKARRLLGYEPQHLWYDEYPEMAARD